jgi:hypothetical protein
MSAVVPASRSTMDAIVSTWYGVKPVLCWLVPGRPSACSWAEDWSMIRFSVCSAVSPGLRL